MNHPTHPQEENWRESAKADELREFINKEFKVKKPTLGGLEREVLIDFVAKEISQERAAERKFFVEELEYIAAGLRGYKCGEHKGLLKRIEGALSPKDL